MLDPFSSIFYVWSATSSEESGCQCDGCQEWYGLTSSQSALPTRSPWDASWPWSSGGPAGASSWHPEVPLADDFLDDAFLGDESSDVFRRRLPLMCGFLGDLRVAHSVFSVFSSARFSQVLGDTFGICVRFRTHRDLCWGASAWRHPDAAETRSQIVIPSPLTEFGQFSIWSAVPSWISKCTYAAYAIKIVPLCNELLIQMEFHFAN